MPGARAHQPQHIARIFQRPFNDIVRGLGGEHVDGSAPDNEQRGITDLRVSRQVVRDLLAHIVDRDVL